MRIAFLDFFQDGEQRPGTVVAGGDNLIRELLIVQGRLRLGQFGLHVVPLLYGLKQILTPFYSVNAQGEPDRHHDRGCLDTGSGRIVSNGRFHSSL